MSVRRAGWVLGCSGCGFLASTLRPNIGADAVARPIDEEDREGALAGLRRRNFERILDRLERLARPAGRTLLDVGCAHGWFLDAAARRGYAVHGLEPDRRIGTQAAKRGHDVTIGYFPADLPPGRRYDVVSFNDVFEHLPRPRSAMAECRRRLEPEGLLVLNVPNSRGVFFRLAALLSLIGLKAPYERMWQQGFASPHVSYFHPEALARLARREGLLEVYRGTLDSFEFNGLWQRLRYDRTSSILGSAATWVGIALTGPLLRRLPADISLQIFMRNDRIGDSVQG